MNHAVLPARLFARGEDEVFERHGHGLAGVELEAEDAGLGAAGGLVGDIAG